MLSTALLFLLAGALIGQGGLGLVVIHPTDPLVTLQADLALFTVLLFTDGQRTSLPALRAGWRESGRALGLGMPLTMIGHSGTGARSGRSGLAHGPATRRDPGPV